MGSSNQDEFYSEKRTFVVGVKTSRGEVVKRSDGVKSLGQEGTQIDYENLPTNSNRITKDL